MMTDLREGLSYVCISIDFCLFWLLDKVGFSLRLLKQVVVVYGENTLSVICLLDV